MSDLDSRCEKCEREIERLRGELAQVPETDLGYDLNGVEASWQAQGAAAGWSGWLPHFDLAVARAFTAGSATHDELWARLGQPGRGIDQHHATAQSCKLMGGAVQTR